MILYVHVSYIFSLKASDASFSNKKNIGLPEFEKKGYYTFAITYTDIITPD